MPVVTPPLEIDVANANELRAAILTAIGHGTPAVVIDMTQTAFCDSTGLNVLVRAHKRLSAEGRQLRLVIREPTLLRIFAITGMDRMFHLSETLGDAVSAPEQAAGSAQPSAAGDQAPASGT